MGWPLELYLRRDTCIPTLSNRDPGEHLWCQNPEVDGSADDSDSIRLSTDDPRGDHQADHSGHIRRGLYGLGRIGLRGERLHLVPAERQGVWDHGRFPTDRDAVRGDACERTSAMFSVT